MAALPTYRIVVLGKTGAGKSSLGNTLFGEPRFQMSHSPLSETSICQAESKVINRRHITWIDTPGFFDTNRSEEDMKSKILHCIVECAPGPHAFILVLKVEKFTEHEKAVIQNIFQYFSEEVLRYAIILFTHGDQLPEEMKIEEFVSQSDCLVELVQKCGDRCHVIDNKYWNNNKKNEYRSNKFQMKKLLKTIDKIVRRSKGGYYTNELLQAVEAEIRKEEERIRQTSGAVSPQEAREIAKSTVHKQYVVKVARIVGKGVLIAAMLGGSQIAVLILLGIKGVGLIKKAVAKNRRAKYIVSKEETAGGKTVGTAGGKATVHAASTPNEGAPTKGTSAEKGASKATTGADVFSKLGKFFRRANENTEDDEDEDDDEGEEDDDGDDDDDEEEDDDGDDDDDEEEDDEDDDDDDDDDDEEEDDEDEEEVDDDDEEDKDEDEEDDDDDEEILEGAPVEETETTEVLPTTETEGAAAGAAVEGAADATTVKDAVGGAVQAEGEGTAALTTAAEEEIDGALLSAAEEAASEVALSAGGADSIAAAVEGVAELSMEEVEMEAVGGAVEVVIDTVAQVVDIIAEVAESCCIQ